MALLISTLAKSIEAARQKVLGARTYGPPAPSPLQLEQRRAFSTQTSRSRAISDVRRGFAGLKAFSDPVMGVAGSIATDPQMYGFRDFAQADAARVAPFDEDERRRAEDYFGALDRFPQYKPEATSIAEVIARIGSRIGDVPLFTAPVPQRGGGKPDPVTLGEAGRGTYDVARTEIPYSSEIAKVAGEVGANAGRTLRNVTGGPLAGPIDYAIERAGFPSPGSVAEGAGRFIGETAVPTEVWMAALELVPGIGTVPGVASWGRKALARALEEEGLPLTTAGVRTLISRKTPEGVREAIVAGERGTMPFFGAGERVGPLRAADEGVGGAGGAGDDFSWGSGGDVPEARDVDDLARMRATGELRYSSAPFPGANWLSPDGQFVASTRPMHAHNEIYKALGAESERDMYDLGYVRISRYDNGRASALSGGTRAEIESAARQLIRSGESPDQQVGYDIFDKNLGPNQNRDSGRASLAELAGSRTGQRLGDLAPSRPAEGAVDEGVGEVRRTPFDEKLEAARRTLARLEGRTASEGAIQQHRGYDFGGFRGPPQHRGRQRAKAEQRIEAGIDRAKATEQARRRVNYLAAQREKYLNPQEAPKPPVERTGGEKIAALERDIARNEQYLADGKFENGVGLTDFDREEAQRAIKRARREIKKLQTALEVAPPPPEQPLRTGSEQPVSATETGSGAPLTPEDVARGGGSAGGPPGGPPSASGSGGSGGAATVTNPRPLPQSAREVLDEPYTKRPTIQQIEARSKPLTPEQRSRFHRDTDRAFYDPPDFRASTDAETADATGLIGRTLQHVQDIAAKIPVVKSIASFIEPTAAARSARKAGNIIPEAIVRREVYAGTQKAQARAALFGWMEKARVTLGMDGKGIARNVGVKPGADVPAAVRGRIDDIVEHPEDYVLSPEQEALVAEARHTFNAVTQRQLEAGVDVREIEGGYFPRIVRDSPKGAPERGGGSYGAGFTTKPGHAKAREFTDLREGVAAGYTYENPIEAMQARLDSGIESIAGRRTLETVKALGEKPSERVPQALRDAYLDAKQAYKVDRSLLNEKALEQAKRALRVAATKANEPGIGEVKAFGRIFPKSVGDELAKYTDITDPGALETFFRIQRASTTTGDLSATFIQGGNLWARNPIAAFKALGYSIVSTMRTPMGYVARNADMIREGIDAGAISPPSEFLLRGGGALEALGRKPVVKQAQQAFEWMIFVGQTEWWKGARGLAKTPAEQKELGAVIRKATGSMLRPGLTRRQRQLETGTLFAGRFLAAVNGLALDAARGGVRGAEARRTLGSMIAGASALTIAGQFYTDGTMPNFTDPSNRDKPWLGIKRPGGSVNLFGPLYPYVRAYASIAQSLADGKTKQAADDATFLLRSRASLPLAAVLDNVFFHEDVVGNEIEDGPMGPLKYFAERFVPLSERELSEGVFGLDSKAPFVTADSGALVENLTEFPEGIGQAAGLRTSRASEYRQKVNAAEPYIEQSNGDFRAAYDAALADDNADALDIIKSEWRNSLRPRIEALKFEVIPGAFDEETGLARGPRIAFTAMERKILADEGVKRRMESTFKIDVGGAQSLSEVRQRYIDLRAADYARKASVSIDEAKDALGKYFDNSEVVSGTVTKRNKDGSVRERAKDGIKDKLEAARIAQWQKDPALFWDAVAVGWEEASEVERELIPRP